MNVKPSDFVIVIGRQCGSGGRELGKALALHFGIPYYDRRLLSEASRELGMRHDLFERNDEKRPSRLRAWLGSGYGATEQCYLSQTLSDDTIQRMQAEVIERLIAHGPCVIVGRGADYIGRNAPNLLSIFLHAPLDERVRRVRSREACSASDREIAEMLTRQDARRRDYYNDFTGRRWGEADNYHLCIDTSLIDTDAIVGIVERYLLSLSQKMNL